MRRSRYEYGRILHGRLRLAKNRCRKKRREVERSWEVSDAVAEDCKRHIAEPVAPVVTAVLVPVLMLVPVAAVVDRKENKRTFDFQCALSVI